MDVPRELADRKQWVCWRNKAGRKVPYQPNGEYAKSNDPATWSTLADCQAAGGFTGIGYVFAEDDPFCGIDLDGCYHEGEIQPWASEILETLSAVTGYAEISPSGTGIKIWTRARLPDGKGRKATVADGQQIEVYDRGRYFCFTGRAIGDQDIGDGQDAVDAILARFWPPAPKSPTPAPRQETDVTVRAAAYLDRCPPAVSGQNGHGTTIRVAACLVRGFELGQEDAYRVIQRWNDTCKPPWSEKELRHKLADAAKHTGERGWLLNGHGYTGPDVDLRAFLARIDGPRVAEAVRCEDIIDSDAVESMPEDLLKPAGLLSEIVEYTLDTSKYPQPEIALASAICLLSVLTGRKVCDSIDTRTNVYVLTVNPARSGKDRPREVNKEVLYLANGQEMVGPERIGSHAGLVSWVDRSPAILFQIDELGRLLATTKNASKAPHLYSIPTVLMSLYSSATNIWIADAYADTKKTKTVDQPHCVVLGTTTAETLWPNLSTENIEDGLMGRLLVFEGRGYVDFHDEIKKRPIPSAILQAASWWVQFQPGEKRGNLGTFHPIPHVVQHEPDAWATFLAHVKEINSRRKKENPFRAAVWSGTAEKTAKLALIHACSRARGTPAVVTVEDVTWGKRLANWLTRKMLMRCSEEVSENDVEAKPKRILRIIGKGKFARNELVRRLQWLRPRERQEILNDMVDCGLLACEIESTGGRPKTWYWNPSK
jgi:hypothetical protein